MKPRLPFFRDLLLLLVWLGVIFSWSTGAGAAPHTNSWVDAFLGRLFPHWYARLTWPEHDAIHFYLRKAAHVTEYALLGVLAIRALRYGRSPWVRGLMSAWILATLYAATDEAHQIFVADRTPKVTDVLLDSAGAAVGVCLTAWLASRRARRSEAGKNRLAVER